MIIWPALVPSAPLVAAYQRMREDNRLAFKPDVGPPKRRRRSTARSRLHGFQLILSRDQLRAFDAFYDDDIADGTLPFMVTDPVERIAVAFTFETPPNDAAISSDRFRVSFTLREMP